MAKKAKKNGAKLPKTIAGVKVPKPLRKRGGKVIEALNHPLVSDLAAAALLAAAAALRDNKGVRAAAGEAKRKSGATLEDVVSTVAAIAEEGVRKMARGAKARD